MARKYTPNEIAGIIKSWSDKVSGGDKEFYKVMSAIALTESGGNPYAVGDQGNSIGLFQNNMAGGRGSGHSRENLLDPEYNSAISIPPLYRVYLDGASKGLKGADLVAYVSRHGQRPAEGLEWNAAKNYGKFIGETPTVMNEQTTQEQYNMAENTKREPTPTINPYEMVDTISVETGKRGQAPRYPEEYKKAEFLRKNREEMQKPVYERFIDYFNPFQSVEANDSRMTPATNAKSNSYIVKPGDTLWGIAERTLGSGNRWKELKGYSGTPESLPVGTRITPPKPFQPMMSTNQGIKPSTSGTPVRQTSVVSQPMQSTVPTPYTPNRYVAPMSTPQSRQSTQKTKMAAPKQSTQVKKSGVTGIIQNALNIVKSWSLA